MIAASSASPAAAPRLAGGLLGTQPDIRLAQLAGEGSEAAFEEIVRRYRSGLVAFAGKIASRESADDVVQDSMVKAHSALLRGDRPDSPRAWLFRIVRNTALNERRDNRPHDHLDEHYDGVEQPPEAADRRRQLRDLVLAMRALPGAQREAIVQRELEGKGHEEIAAALDITPGAVRQLIFRARSALRAGIGALLPMQLLRAAVLSGAPEQASSGAAATGAGVAAKLGLSALLTTGALVAGTHSVKDRAAPTAHQQPVAASASATASSEAKRVGTSQGSAAGTESRRHQVIVAPGTAASRHSAAPASHEPPGSPQGDHGGSEAPGGSTPPSAGPGGAGGGGGHPDAGGTSGVQSRSAPGAQDCQSDTGRDPGPRGVSPG